MQKACKTAKILVFPEQREGGPKGLRKEACQPLPSRWIVPADHTKLVTILGEEEGRQERGTKSDGPRLSSLLTSEFQTSFPNSSEKSVT